MKIEYLFNKIGLTVENENIVLFTKNLTFENEDVDITKDFKFDESLSFEENLKRMYVYVALNILRENLKYVFDNIYYDLSKQEIDKLFFNTKDTHTFYFKRRTSPILQECTNSYLNEYTNMVVALLGFRKWNECVYKIESPLDYSDKILDKNLMFILRNTNLKNTFFDITSKFSELENQRILKQKNSLF